MIAKPLHLRIGDAREGRGGRNTDAGHEGEQRIAQHRGHSKAARQTAQQSIEPAIDVGHRPGLADEFPHQQEQWNHRKDKVANCLIGGRGQHRLNGTKCVDVRAGNKENTQRTGHPQGNSDVDADRHEGDQADDQQDGNIYFEHKLRSLSVAARG